MNRLFLLGGMLALAVAFSSVRAEDDKKEEKLPTIKQIMKTTHGKTAFSGKAGAALKAKDFETLSKIAKEWEKCAVAMAKSTPKKGGKESWEALTTAYLENIKTLGEGAAKKDAGVVDGALKVVGTSCGMCHPKHK